MLPPIVKLSASGRVVSSSRIETFTVASNAELRPRRRTGDVIVARAAGSVSRMFGVAEPSTHHELSVPSRRTMTVVTGPRAVPRTGTSPERASPGRNAPTTGAVISR